MAVRTAKAAWEGNIQAGKGTMALGSGASVHAIANRFRRQGDSDDHKNQTSHRSVIAAFSYLFLRNRVRTKSFNEQAVHLSAREESRSD